MNGTVYRLDAMIRPLALVMLAACATDPNTTEQPVSCTLSPSELKARRDELIPGLLERAQSVTELPEGLRLHFASEPGLIAELGRVIEREQVCCSFLEYVIRVDADGAVVFEITGPPGTGEMLRGLRE